MEHQDRRYFAACTLGLEEVLVAELRALGARAVRPARGGAHCEGPLELGYRACLWLRSAVRWQEEILCTEVRRRGELYDAVASVDWSRYLRNDQTLAIQGRVKDSFTGDPRSPALWAKDAIVDQFRDRTGIRPDVDRRDPILPLRLVLRRHELLLYRDWSGESLHKRGYRPIQVKSPLNESLAAGLLLLAGWEGQGPLLDPMAGSGTFAVEAAWIAGDRAPGLHRAFPFDLWPDFLGDTWASLIEEAEQREEAGRERIPPIEIADRHGGALELARRSLRSAGVEGVSVQQRDIGRLRPATAPAWIVVNPPYGERLGEGSDLVESWRELGTFLHERCPGAVAHVLSGNPELPRHLRLKADRRWPVKNGPIDCRWLRYALHPE